MPNESINDTESVAKLVNTYNALLEQIQLSRRKFRFICSLIKA